ncbi:uncharacterized protein BDV14DRAFT_187037 [Aspergillus stella-maris]|uniref:uncharacterized protein n=1 Tax=Aspergillus stella-maris TaxID=1810926 RepID=UPI003CCD6704
MERAQTMPIEAPATSDSPTTPIIRPADIYKRMREEQKPSQPTSPSTDDHTLAAGAPVNPAPISATSSFETSAPPENDVPTIALPEMKRMSAFGSNFFADPESAPSAPSAPQNSQDPGPHQLQHSSSLGFRSAVNQAFDVPETPSTTADSVARSNSDSTAGISPIMARRDTTDDKTPTIPEEPSEHADTPTEGKIVFKPGHRRDLSIPSPGNSPSRRPEIAGPETSASSDLAQVTAGTPTEPQPSYSQLPYQQSRSDLPAPLNVQTTMVPGPTASTENIPVIIPTSAETSPEDTENDRLRKEIIRSLSRENSPSEHQDNDTPPQTSGQPSLFPGEYEGYNKGEPQSTDVPQPLAAPIQTPPIEQPTPIAPQGKPKLKKRFSWEESSGDDEPTPVPQEQPSRPPPMPGQFPFSQESVHPESVVAPATQPAETANPINSTDEVPPEKPQLTVVPPLPVDDTTSLSSSGHERTFSQNTEALGQAEEGELFNPGQQLHLEPPAPLPPPSNEAGLLGFKDILGIQSSEGRVQAFDRTRDQFAGIDTGLAHWLHVTVYAHPEHTDVIERNAKPLSEEFKNSVPRNKFPKLTSLGNLASSLQDGSHSTSGHIRRPSAPLGSMRQQSGKDFLHTAGALGGQAGKAAKGLFSRANAIPVLLRRKRSRTRTILLFQPVRIKPLRVTVLIHWALNHTLASNLEESRDSFLPLYQLPSVPSLGEHEADLGPSPPLAQKLGDALAQREVIQTSPARANVRPASNPGLQSPFPSKHDWSHRPEQISSSRDPAALRLSASPMEKLKNVGRFRRISMGPDQPDYKSEQPRKHFKLSGIFSRHQHRKSAPPQPILESSSEGSTRHYLAPTSSRPDSRIASSSISSFDQHERPISLPDARNTYTNGRRQPTEGFFAHESPESFTVAKAHPPHLRGAASSDRIRMSDPTPIDPRRLSPHSLPYPPRHPHVSSSSRLGSPLPTATSSPIPRTPPSRGRSEERTYAQDLHLRSRSPKAFAPRPEERTLPKHDTTDPAYRLGAFRSSNPRTSRSGDQELPWKITIPGEEHTEPTTTTSTSASWRQETEEILNVTRLPTYQEDEEEYGPPALAQQLLDEKRRPPLSEHPAMLAPTSHPNPNLNLNFTSKHPHRSGARTVNAVDAPVELPVRTDDNSSEEIMMSSTAYPGQEWRPLGFSEWDHQ